MDDRTLVKLINENKGLMYQIINKYKTYYDKDDLYQSTVIGIIKAYNNYDSTRDVKFSTYAYKYMLSEVISFIKSSKLIKTSRDYDKIYKKVLEAKTILAQRLMKEPSVYELSQFLEIDEGLINNILLVKEQVKSLDDAILEDGKTITLLDNIKSRENNINIDNILLDEMLSTLTLDELKLIKLRYFQDKTQRETAEYLKTNQVQVSRNETKILKKLKKASCNVA